MNAVDVKNMVKRYDKFELSVDRLEIPSGCMTGIIGRNGAGKTTLIKSILGITEYDSGNAEILGRPMDGNERELKKKIGIMWGRSGIYSNVRLKNITKAVKRFYDNWSDDTYEKLIKKFNLDESKKYRELSMGQCTVYNIALALSHNAEILIMDEPTAGLDPIVRSELMDVFAGIMEEKEVTVIISTHITSDLDRMADYIALIDNGKLIFNMPKDELVEGHRVVKGGADALTDDVKKNLISYKINAYNFEGLTANAGYMKSKYRDFVYEKPLIEDIMRFMTKEAQS